MNGNFTFYREWFCVEFQNRFDINLHFWCSITSVERFIWNKFWFGSFTSVSRDQLFRWPRIHMNSEHFFCWTEYTFFSQHFESMQKKYLIAIANDVGTFDFNSLYLWSMSMNNKLDQYFFWSIFQSRFEFRLLFNTNISKPIDLPLKSCNSSEACTFLRGSKAFIWF